MSKELVKLVKLAKQGNNDAITRILDDLKPVLIKIACGLTNRRPVDWIVQDGLVGVWLSLKNVNIERPQTMRAFMTKSGVNHMKKSIISLDRVHKYSNNNNSIIFDESDVDHFSGLLGEYVKYIKEIGSMHGSHAHLARVHGMTRSNMMRLFYKEVEKHLNESSICKWSAEE
jgi:DNA-directed RNA polymerase specialized sigma24 family protein